MAGEKGDSEPSEVAGSKGWMKESRTNKSGQVSSIFYHEGEVDSKKYPHITTYTDSNGNLVLDDKTRCPKNHASESKDGSRYGGREIRGKLDNIRDNPLDIGDCETDSEVKERLRKQIAQGKHHHLKKLRGIS